MEDSGFDSVDKGSPGLKPFYPKIKPSPSPPLDTPPPKHMPSTTANHEDHGPGKACGTSGDAVLVEHLGNGQKPEIARSAAEEDLPPDQDDKDLMKNVTFPGSQAPVKPTLKRLHETAFGASEQDNGRIPHPTRWRVVHQLDNETGDGHPNGGLLTNSSKGVLQVSYTDDTSPPEEVPRVTQAVYVIHLDV
ncbi:hypothetical protein NCS52_01581100 [Fusarium sp. LHS14.1]|nr:hypothetical protein NCS52_01581100 [Fusarium sp. LHS14.1]